MKKVWYILSILGLCVISVVLTLQATYELKAYQSSKLPGSMVWMIGCGALLLVCFIAIFALILKCMNMKDNK